MAYTPRFRELDLTPDARAALRDRELPEGLAASLAHGFRACRPSALELEMGPPFSNALDCWRRAVDSAATALLVNDDALSADDPSGEDFRLLFRHCSNW